MLIAGVGSEVSNGRVVGSVATSDAQDGGRDDHDGVSDDLVHGALVKIILMNHHNKFCILH